MPAFEEVGTMSQALRRERQIPLVSKAFTKKQQKLMVMHGTPSEFAEAIYAAVPGFISMDEAK